MKSNTLTAKVELPVVGCPPWVSFKRKLIGLARAPANSFTAVSVYSSFGGWCDQAKWNMSSCGGEQVPPSTALVRHCPLPKELGNCSHVAYTFSGSDR